MRKTNNLLKQERCGEVSYTKYGTKAIIVEYKNNKEVLVEFQDEYKYKYYASYSNFRDGKLTNPYDKRYCGVGYIGVGRYNMSNCRTALKKWCGILQRVTLDNSDDLSTSVTSYVNCEISDEWLNFQNFAEWYENNKYELNNGERLAIDKDILWHNNKIYCKERCLLVPEKINSLFIKEKSRRGELPIGVKQPKDKSYYIAGISKYGKNVRIGSYPTKEDAFYAYKKEKEKHIKEVANNYKDIIPKKVYNALMDYKVEITD